MGLSVLVGDMVSIKRVAVEKHDFFNGLLRYLGKSNLTLLIFFRLYFIRYIKNNNTFSLEILRYMMYFSGVIFDVSFSRKHQQLFFIWPEKEVHHVSHSIFYCDFAVHIF